LALGSSLIIRFSISVFALTRLATFFDWEDIGICDFCLGGDLVKHPSIALPSRAQHFLRERNFQMLSFIAAVLSVANHLYMTKYKLLHRIGIITM
jgi:hypothetical protein